LLRHHSTVKRN